MEKLFELFKKNPGATEGQIFEGISGSIPEGINRCILEGNSEEISWEFHKWMLGRARRRFALNEFLEESLEASLVKFLNYSSKDFFKESLDEFFSGIIGSIFEEILDNPWNTS